MDAGGALVRYSVGGAAQSSNAKFVDPNANVYIYGIPPDWNDAELQQVFGQFGPILSSKVARNPDGTGKGYGFVGFYNPTNAQTAISTLNGVEVGGRSLVVRLKDDPQKGPAPKASGASGGSSASKVDPNANVYLYGLPPQWGDDELQQIFGQFGGIVSTKVPRNEDGTSKGYGFVGFVSPVSAQTAIMTFDQTEINGKKLTVRLKTEGSAPIGLQVPAQVMPKAPQVNWAALPKPVPVPPKQWTPVPPKQWTPVPPKQWAPVVNRAPAPLPKAEAHCHDFQGQDLNMQEARRKPPVKVAPPWRPVLPNLKPKVPKQEEKITPPGCAAYIFYMPGSWDENELERHFSHCGDIQGVTISRHPDGKSKGLGFVNFSHPECVLKAMFAMDGFAAAENRFLSVSPKMGEEACVPPVPSLEWPQQGDPEVGPTYQWSPPGANIFIYYLPLDWGEEQLYRHFIHYGEISELRVSEGKGYGFVKFRHKLSAVRALKGMHGFNTGKMRLDVSIKKGEEDHVQAEIEAVSMIKDFRFVASAWSTKVASSVRSVPAGANVYVCSFPQNWQEADLRENFSIFGNIMSMKLARNPQNGSSMGYGFVGFDNPQSADMAVLQMNGLELAGKPLIVKLKEEKGAPGAVFSSAATPTESLVALDAGPLALEAGGMTLEAGLATGQWGSEGHECHSGDLGNGDFSTPPQARGGQTIPQGANVYVSGFPSSWTEADLEGTCAAYGNIISAKVARYDDGKSCCYGFVGFGLPQGAQEAIEGLNAAVVEGKRLIVKLKEDKGYRPY